MNFQPVKKRPGSYAGIAHGSLASDPALYNNLNDAAVMMARLMPRLDRALRDLEVFADKLARHPELIGIGGAVNPSRGLKESPTAPYPYQHPPGR